MPTETITVQLLLDARDQQQMMLTLLQDIAEQQEENSRILRGIGKLLRDKGAKPQLSLPPGLLTTGLQYLAVAGALVYLLKGGDLEKLAGAAKLFGLL
jgi:hypothetical protein